MARLIVKSPYIKCGSGQGAGGYMKYIATRERVEIIPDDRPPTRKQEQLITKLENDFPDTKNLLEYEDYIGCPTKANASSLITLALEENWSQVQTSEGYAKYIATRPRAERLGDHGLFGDEGCVDLDKAMSELEHYTGNVWTHIISLHREDAERLGYDNAQAWRSLLRTHRNDIAAAMKIPPQDFRWYAAFHDEGKHPHVHMMAWSVKPGQAYLSKDGICQIKSTLTNQIFKQEMLHLYEQKSESRNELVRETRNAMLELSRQMSKSVCEHPQAEQLLLHLAQQLGEVKGKKSYGYLPKALKKQVDGIVDQMERLPVVNECYQKWWDLQCSANDFYSEKERRRPPLSQQKEFRAIKNAVIQEAERIRQNISTRRRKRITLGPQYLLGNLHLMGEGVERDENTAYEWFHTAAEQGHTYAQFFVDRIDQQKQLVSPSLLLSATRLLHHMGNIFKDNVPTTSTSGGMHIDHKRLQKLRAKKITLGHKPDDHEEEQNVGDMAMGGW